MITNEGVLDRVLRGLLGLALIGLDGFGIVTGLWGAVLTAAGVLTLVTAVSGWCPLYSLIHWDTHCAPRQLAQFTHHTRGGAR